MIDADFEDFMVVRGLPFGAGVLLFEVGRPGWFGQSVGQP